MGRGFWNFNFLKPSVPVKLPHGLQAFQFFVSIWGLVASIGLMNNGASTCPAHGVDCGWLVFLFTVTMILNAFRANRVEMPPEDGEQQPIAEWNRNSRVIVAPFVFHRESFAHCLCYIY